MLCSSNVCKREHMQLQEDKCRPGCMQLKLEASVELGVRSASFLILCLKPVLTSVWNLGITCHTFLKMRTVKPTGVFP
jgi:hypothetical protein